MAFITWQSYNSYIIKLESGDYYNDELGTSRAIYDEQYLLLIGDVNSDFGTHYNIDDCIRISIADYIEHKYEPIIRCDEVPDVDEWLKLINEHLDKEESVVTIEEIKRAVGQLKPTVTVEQPKQSAISAVGFSIECVLPFGASVALPASYIMG